MARLRYNGLATTLGAGLAPTDTAVTFATSLTHSGGVAVPTIAGSDFIPLTILNAAGAVSEIVHLTAYTTGATTGTITRARESTTGVAHTTGDAVIHAPTAADFDESMPYVSVRRSADLSLTAATTTAVPYDIEVEDSFGFHSTTTNPDRLTVPAGMGGVYVISVGSEFTNTASGERVIHLRKNGGSDFISLDTRVDPVSPVRPQMSVVARLADGDYIQALAYSANASVFKYAWAGTPSLGYPGLSMVRLGK